MLSLLTFVWLYILWILCRFCSFDDKIPSTPCWLTLYRYIWLYHILLLLNYENSHLERGKLPYLYKMQLDLPSAVFRLSALPWICITFLLESTTAFSFYVELYFSPLTSWLVAQQLFWHCVQCGAEMETNCGKGTSQTGKQNKNKQTKIKY